MKKLTEEGYLSFCKSVLPLPTELMTCRDCPALEECTRRQGPVDRCPLVVLGSAGLGEKGVKQWLKKKKISPETPQLCVCGAVPVMVKTRLGLMYSCSNTIACSIRSTWQKMEPLACHAWNMAVDEAKTNGGGRSVHEYIIHFRRGRKGEARLVIMPTEKKLLAWIEKNAGACSQVRIIKSEGNEA